MRGTLNYQTVFFLFLLAAVMHISNNRREVLTNELVTLKQKYAELVSRMDEIIDSNYCPTCGRPLQNIVN